MTTIDTAALSWGLLVASGPVRVRRRAVGPGWRYWLVFVVIEVAVAVGLLLAARGRFGRPAREVVARPDSPPSRG